MKRCRIGKRKETFYTHIAKILHECGPLPVAEIYTKLFARIGPQLNKNWKNSVRHALSSKSTFFAKCTKRSTSNKSKRRRRHQKPQNTVPIQTPSRGRAWTLIEDYDKLINSQPKHASRGRRVISEVALAKMKKLQDYNEIISTFYNFYFVNNAQQAAVEKVFDPVAKKLVDKLKTKN